MKKLSNTSKAVAATAGTGILATTISIPLMMGEQASKYALRPDLKDSGLEFFEAETDRNLILTSLSQGLGFPFKSFDIPANTIHLGGSEIKVEVQKNGVIAENSPAIEQLKNQCLTALDKGGGYKSGVEKWCASLSIKKILKKHGLNSSTSKEKLKNTIVHKLSFPIETFKIEQNSLFTGSEEIQVPFDTSKKIFELENASEKLVQQCSKVLELKELGENQKYLKNAQTWCVELTIKEALERNGFETLDDSTDDSIWEQIIKGEWFINQNLYDQKVITNKSLFSSWDSISHSNYKNISSSVTVTKDQIEHLKNVCRNGLQEPFKRIKFPKSTKLSAGDTEGPKHADKFQELTYFCVKPITAEEYVTKNLKKEIKAREGSSKQSCTNLIFSWYTFKNFTDASDDTETFWRKVFEITQPKHASDSTKGGCLEK